MPPPETGLPTAELDTDTYTVMAFEGAEPEFDELEEEPPDEALLEPELPPWEDPFEALEEPMLEALEPLDESAESDDLEPACKS